MKNLKLFQNRNLTEVASKCVAQILTKCLKNSHKIIELLKKLQARTLQRMKKEHLHGYFARTCMNF